MATKLEEYKKLSQDYVETLKEVGIPVDAAYIFGSRVSGLEHRWSDLDMCIVSPAFGVDSIAERVVLQLIGRNDFALIEPHPFSSVDFENKFNPLANEIRTTGVKIA